MEQRSTWETSEGKPSKPQKQLKLKHRQPFEITEKTTKAMADTIEGWNEMRQCLIDNNLMESK